MAYLRDIIRLLHNCLKHAEINRYTRITYHPLSAGEQKLTDTIIVNGKILTPYYFIENGYVIIKNGEIIDLGIGEPKEKNGEIIDAKNNIVAPGFIDTHTHGYKGVDASYSPAPDILKWAKEITRHGTTAFLPSTVSLPHDQIITACKNIVEAMNKWTPINGARILGIHLEGPYISKEKKGAQNPEYIRKASISEVEEYIKVSQNNLVQITLAPEVDGALDLIKFLSRRGIVVSLGHSVSDYETAVKAILLGAKKATHLYNAMPPIHHRKPGLVIALLRHNSVFLELISDYIHVSPEMVLFTIEYAGINRVVLITDSISATMLPDGEYSLGGLRVEVRDGIPRIAGTNTLAGSTLTMDKAVKNLVNKGINLKDAIAMATITPAKSIGIYHKLRIGEIKPGFKGDLIVLNKEDLRVEYTIVNGTVVYERNE